MNITSEVVELHHYQLQLIKMYSEGSVTTLNVFTNFCKLFGIKETFISRETAGTETAQTL